MDLVRERKGIVGGSWNKKEIKGEHACSPEDLEECEEYQKTATQTNPHTP